MSKSSFSISMLCCMNNDEGIDSSEITPKKETIKKCEILENTIKRTKDVKFVCERPSTPRMTFYPHECPICFRYFNKIWKLKCCNNHICAFCIDDLLNTALKSEKNGFVCCFCKTEDALYEALNENDPIKKYTDSPYLEKFFKGDKEIRIQDIMNYQRKEQLRELIKLIDKRIVEKLMIDRKENTDPNLSKVIQDLINFKIRIEQILQEEMPKRLDSTHSIVVKESIVDE